MLVIEFHGIIQFEKSVLEFLQNHQIMKLIHIICVTMMILRCKLYKNDWQWVKFDKSSLKDVLKIYT